MQYRETSKGLKLPALILGSWSFGDPSGTYAKQSDEVEDAIVKAALDAGINAFDTAEAYGAGISEKALGRALAKSGKERSEYQILSKIHPRNLVTPELIETALNRTLENLGTSYVDLYQIHYPNHTVPLIDVLQVLDKFRKEGKIRAIGVSNFGLIDFADAKASGIEFVSNQLGYSLVNRVIEHKIQQQAIDNNVAILAYSPLGQGLLSGKYTSADQTNEGLNRSRYFHHTRSSKAQHNEQGCEKELFESIAKVKAVADRLGVSLPELAIAWVLKQPGVTSAVIGVSKPEHIAQNLRALKIDITDKIDQELKIATEPVKVALGENMDLWFHESRCR